MEKITQPHNRNRNGRSCAANTIAALFSTLFIFSTILSILLVNTALILLHPGLYKKTLNSQEVYEKLPDLASQQIVHSMSFNPCLQDPNQCGEEEQSDTDETQEGFLQDGPPTYFENLSEDDWTAIFSLLLSHNWLQSQTESLIDQFFSALDHGEDGFELIISMEGLRSSLNEENTAQIINTLLDSAPPCSEEELSRIAMIVLGQSGERLPICLPTVELKPFLKEELQISIQALAADLPNETKLKLNLFESTEGDDILVKDGLIGKYPLYTLRTIRGVFTLSLLMPIFALMMIALFAVRSWFSLLRWWGIPLAISGLLILLPTAAWQPVYRWLVSTFIMPNITAGFTPELINTVVSFAQNIISRFTFWIGLEGGLLFFLGCGMYILSRFFQSNTKS